MPDDFISKEQLEASALEMGFAAVRYISLREDTSISQEAQERYRRWLDEGMHASMAYMENYRDVRQSPSALLPGAKTLIIGAMSYYSEQKQDPKAPKLPRYAMGRDYHKVLKKSLKGLVKQLHSNCQSEHEYRILVDTAPLPERYWAAVSQLGAIGKNTCLIVPRVGSFCFIGSLITTLEIRPRNECDLQSKQMHLADQCLSCNRCIRACPVQALSASGLDARRCINFWTIENQSDSIPDDINSRMGKRLVGCDTCQDVCPYNRESKPTKVTDLIPRSNLLTLTENDFLNMSEADYEALFFGTPLTRTKWKGMQRNIHYYFKRKKK